jgi:hypothetical protein
MTGLEVNIYDTEGLRPTFGDAATKGLRWG